MDESQELRAVMDISLTPLLLVDDERNYVSANEAAANLFGTPLSDLLRRRVDEFVAPRWHPSLDQLWAQLVASGRSEGKGDIVRSDGHTVSIQYRAMLNFRPGRHLFALREMRDGDGDGAVATSISRRGRRRASDSPLTARQREILQLAAGGCSTAEIADILFLSPGTVKTHFEHIYKKLSVGDRASAVAFALRQGMID
jgi:PAS domain S-box-containing protein